MLAVAARAGLALGHGDHRLHRDDHARLEHGVDVLAQLQAGLAAVVVREDAEGVAVAEGAVRQQAVADVDLVELVGDVLAHGAGLDQLDAGAVHLDVDVPQTQRLLVGLAEEQRALEGGVVAGGHREGVQRQDVVLLHLPGGGPVVGAVGVDAGLEPHPGVAHLAVREGLRDLAGHGLGAGQRHLELLHTGVDGVLDRLAADVADPCALLDHRDLLGGLDHPLAHRVLGDVDQLGAGEGVLEAAQDLQRDGVVLDAQAPRVGDPALGQGLLERVVEVVAVPVGVDDVLAVAGAPGHARVDVRGDGAGVVGGDDHAVGAAEVREQEVRVVLDALVAGEDHGVEVLLGHDPAQAAEAALELGVGEGQLLLLAVVEDLEALEVVDGGCGGRGHDRLLRRGTARYVALAVALSATLLRQCCA